MHIPPYVIGGLLALLFTYAIAYEMRGVARGLGAMTPPGGRHIHTQPVPRLGGLAIFGGALLALLATLPIDQSVALVRETRYIVLAVPYKPLPLPVVGILLGAAAITALGAIDDVRSLPGRVKFPLIYAAASIPVWFGMTTDFITHPVTGAVIPLGMAGKVFTVVWLGSMAIAMNSIDGVDGLAAGVSVITGMTLLSAAFGRWWTWWLGDTGGVLVVTPLLLIMWYVPWPDWDRRRWAEAALVFAAAALFTVIIFVWWRPPAEL